MQVYIHKSGALILKVPIENMTKMREFFEAFGLTFVLEKHGAGPDHFACEMNGKTLEIYPDI